MVDFNLTAKINRVPCWGLQFLGEADGGAPGTELLSVDHGGHVAEIFLSLDGGLTAGRVDIALGRLTAKDFEKLVRAQLLEAGADPARRAPSPRRVFVKVMLYWQNPLARARDFSDDLVIETFRITRMCREVDGLDVVTRIEGRRALYDRIAARKTPAGDGITTTDTLAGVADVLTAAGFTANTDFIVYPATGTQPPNAQRFEPEKPLLQILARLREQMLRRPPYRRGRSLYLIRDGKLHVGPFRPIPHSGSTKAMSAEVGLISVKETGTTGALTAAETALDDAPAARANYELHCAGRSDIQPGDVLTFRKPSETEGLMGGFGLPGVPDVLGASDEDVTLYVASVTQKLALNEGWITTVSGVSVEGTPVSETAWDVVRTRGGQPPADEAAQAGQPAARVAQAVGRRINQAFAARPVSAVGEVREHHTTTRVTGEQVEQAAQTSVVLRGIDDLGGPRQARLDEIDRARNDLQANVPYVTNFAWGPFGHVLPRYPGMRVMMLNNNSNDDDPVEIGALWQTKDAEASRAPTNTQSGDWWLILPAYGDNDPPRPAAGTDAVSPDSSLKASHDLITAKGERAIEVNGFTIRAHQAASLTAPSARPAVPTADADKGGILIEQVDGSSKIRMLKDGTIEIEAGGDLKLKGDNIRLVARGSGTVDASNEPPSS